MVQHLRDSGKATKNCCKTLKIPCSEEGEHVLEMEVVILNNYYNSMQSRSEGYTGWCIIVGNIGYPMQILNCRDIGSPCANL